MSRDPIADPLERPRTVADLRTRLQEDELKKAREEYAPFPKSLQETAPMIVSSNQSAADEAAQVAKRDKLPKVRALLAEAVAAHDVYTKKVEAHKQLREEMSRKELPIAAAVDRSWSEYSSLSNRLDRERRAIHRECLPEYQVRAVQTFLLDLAEALTTFATNEKDWVIRAGAVAALQRLRQPIGGSVPDMLEGIIEPAEDLAVWLANHLQDVAAARDAAIAAAREEARKASKQTASTARAF